MQVTWLCMGCGITPERATKTVDGYAAHHVFSVRAQEAFGRATILVARVVEPFGSVVRCHELARAVLLALEARGGSPLVLQDGECAGVQHSWLVIDSAILDVYTVARLPMVQLVDVVTPTLQCRLYRCGPMRDDIDHAMVATLRKQMG